MTVIGLDDTDSRDSGMCTTYVADTVARRLVDAGTVVERLLLVRCNPAVEHKTRGNAALAVHTDAAPETAFDVAADVVEECAETAADRTNPGVVVAGSDPDAVPATVAEFARVAVRDHHTREDAAELIDRVGYDHRGWKNGRGTIGALAAVGAWRALEGWTYEHITYRQPDRWGSTRDVDRDSLFRAAAEHYPAAWDTVDRESGEAVCVPRTPGPVLYGIRGDDPDTCRSVASAIDAEPVGRARTFVTNQGTDAHVRTGTVSTVRDGRSFRVDGTVVGAPETRRGGHVFVRLTEHPGVNGADPVDTPGRDPRDDELQCVAFEPTKRFRDRVRALRIGDRLTVCGEVADGTLKLEKFAVRELVRTEVVTPTCPVCDRTMESAGRDQGYRCRGCGTRADGKRERPIDRNLERGWYEVPPRARRHVAKPLVRGGFDDVVHPER